MKNLFIILTLFMVCNSAFGSNENHSKDEIWCSYEKNDTRYHGLEELKNQCEYGLEKIIFLRKHGYALNDINKNFPYFSNFAEKCITFLNSIWKDENGEEVLKYGSTEVVKYGSKDCASVQAIVHAGNEFDVRVKQEGLMIDSEIEKIKEKNE